MPTDSQFYISKILTYSITPESLIDNNGLVQYGHFDSPVPDLGIDKFQYLNEMDKPASILAKYFHFKQFQFVSIISPSYVIGVALADLRYIGNAFCYLYDIEQNKLIETSWLKPLGVGCNLTPSPMNGCGEIKTKKDHILFEIKHGQWRIKINSLNINADLQLEPEPLSLPMAMCTPTGYSGWTYTQKHNALSVSGKLIINDEEQVLETVSAGYDFSAGYMRRETSWRWASINSITENGSLGLNFAAGVNETGCNENVFWLNGAKNLLGPVHFNFKRQRPDDKTAAQWHIYSDNGQVNLTFSPLNCRQERINAFLLKSNFRQYIGHFNGYLIDNEGKQHKINNILGITEDHFARW